MFSKYYVKSWSIILQAVASAMQAKDPFIISAMDGREQISNAPDPTNASREEPTTFFYVVFGLVYEALAAASTDSLANSSARQASLIASLQALKSLVRPEYAGKAILDPTTFDEFISVCCRLAMTESAPIQIHLIEVMTVFAATQGSRYGKLPFSLLMGD